LVIQPCPAQDFLYRPASAVKQPLGVPCGSLDCLIARFFPFPCPLKSWTLVNYICCCWNIRSIPSS